MEQIPAEISAIFETIQLSIGEKVSNLIFSITACFASMVYALYFGWAFAVVCMLYLPFLMGVIAFFGMKVKKQTALRLEGIKNFCGVAEETLSGMKVVASYCNEDRELGKFERSAELTR